ncbi:hypothetical protein LOTGIDRAFT_176076 [Lottia gigantea]|uniref:Ig-like domain-containing protein n=1 Tax=Lottia gigantea TaxID=225164 RepID=V3ZW16_LOTGI|nr:hypothetical protein LOTGIDRAFT_176076 [Lottia gigantea]ESO85141.1 hypothetical protein LOTGIDRAFT_176076 [Lottia gigantea]
MDKYLIKKDKLLDGSDTTTTDNGIKTTAGKATDAVPRCSEKTGVPDGPENIRFNPTSDNIDVIEGKSQSVNCLADCKPDCNINWSKDGSTTILNNPLSLSTRNQTGSYTCTVTHTVLNKQLTKQLNVQIYCKYIILY